MPNRIVLAVDAGGTRTRCVVASSDGRVLGAGVGGPGNHILDGWDVARASLHKAVDEAMRAAGQPGLDAAVAASAGVGAHGEGREVVEELLAELLDATVRRRAAGDMVAALWGALRTPVGVVVSAGTGSVCLGRNAAGEMRQVGGWGHLMGDEGSAYDIALQALRAVARAEDGRAEPTALRAALLDAASAHMDAGGPPARPSSAVELAWQLYAGSPSRERIAAFAAHVAGPARTGDETAKAVLRTAGHELGLLAVTGLRWLGPGQGVVSYTGSVFDAGEPLVTPFVARIRTDLPEARIEPPFLPAIGGALRLALLDVGDAEAEHALEGWRAGLDGLSI